MLTQFKKIRTSLARSVNLAEIKETRDKAEALKIYARTAQNAHEMGRQLAEIKLRCERRIGQLLRGTVKPGNPQLFPTGTIGLEKLGISRKQSHFWQLAATLPDADFEKYLESSRELTTAGVVKLAKMVKAPPPLGGKSGGHILTGDASRLFDYLDDESVDLFLTDPPYDEIQLYEELSELAKAKLKPGGLCLAYCGQWYLPQVLEAMASHLKYHWTFAIRFGGQHRPIHPRHIQNTWQPVVAFSNGTVKSGWIVDLLESGGREKGLHSFQKTASDIEYLIEKLTLPGALVVDPFCGSGTVPTACKNLGRQWLACEVNAKTAAVARGRVAA
jgi:hypothetical protein